MYHDWLSTRLFEMFDNILLSERRIPCFMHDGVPLHFSRRQCWRWLNENFPERSNKLTHSITRIKFHNVIVLGQIKQKLYSQLVNNVENVCQRMVGALNLLTKERTFDRVLFSLEKITVMQMGKWWTFWSINICFFIKYLSLPTLKFCICIVSYHHLTKLNND